MTGTVKFFDAQKGWGYIRVPKSTDIFVHWRDIAGKGFRTLNEGDEVEFDVTKGERGTRAEQVVIWKSATK